MGTIYLPDHLPSNMRFTVSFILFLAASAVSAQPILFGSASDPTEATLDPYSRGAAQFSAFAGPSYKGTEWQFGIGVSGKGTIGPFGVKVEGVVRTGSDFIHVAEVNEAYDIIRFLEYARVEPTAEAPIYLRIGPLRQVTLPTGQLVRDYATTAVWDERTVGAESAIRFRNIELGGFLSDLRFRGLVGGYVRTHPFGQRRTGLRSLRLSAEVVHDIEYGAEDRMSAASAEIRANVWSGGDFRLSPFVSHTRYENYGYGTTAGASIGGDQIAGIARLKFSSGLTFSSEQFIPGHFNAFHSLTRSDSRIVSSTEYFRDPTTQEFVGTPLVESEGGMSWFVEFQGALMDIFEFSQYVRRDFGGSTGAYGLRLTVAPDRGEQFLLRFDLQRQGLQGFQSIFSDLVDEAILGFRMEYGINSSIRAYITARYGYRSLDPLNDGTERFLIERRFEPMIGITYLR